MFLKEKTSSGEKKQQYYVHREAILNMETKWIPPIRFISRSTGSLGLVQGTSQDPSA